MLGRCVRPGLKLLYIVRLRGASERSAPARKEQCCGMGKSDESQEGLVACQVVRARVTALDGYWRPPGHARSTYASAP